MKLRYSVTEFRQKIREILNAVDMGAEVEIVRYDRTYKIERGADIKDQKAKKQTSENFSQLAPDVAEVKSGTRIATTKKKSDQCPHGYAKGFCKKADCNRKFAE